MKKFEIGGFILKQKDLVLSFWVRDRSGNPFPFFFKNEKITSLNIYFL